MNYQVGGETLALEPLESFLKETGSRPEAQAKINVSRSGLPQDLHVMVLEPRAERTRSPFVNREVDRQIVCARLNYSTLT